MSKNKEITRVIKHCDLCPACEYALKDLLDDPQRELVDALKLANKALLVAQKHMQGQNSSEWIFNNNPHYTVRETLILLKLILDTRS